MSSSNLFPEPHPGPATSGPIVRLIDAERRFGATAALNGVSLTVARGEVLGIIGRSGAGKSTLIRCLNGLERVDSGVVEIEGRDITRLDERQLQPLRRRIGMVFQHFNLLSSKTVAANIGLPLKIAGQPRAQRAARVTELLDLVGLQGMGDRYPAQLSGGQKQRVGIARALAARPSLLLCDEATSALDPETTRSVLALLRDINRSLGVTIVLITHEMEVIRRVADRVVVLDQGQIAEQGPVADVFADPQADTTRSLLQVLRPQLPADLRQKLHPTAGAEALLHVEVAGAAARQPLIGDIGRELGWSVRLVHGGIDHVQDHPVGSLYLGVPNVAGAVESVTRWLQSRAARIEVLGYVPADA
ncbi:methionine ABC transporter ATP-binding protein [Geminicoccus roseus]|uniref:methionine ABC transporter ATP-binding protein n=1 Tax=Geminicoccus roseus TaxID=404900 RepID=UPI0003F91DE8|nr:ATP-binding cassette domain-containing protein [Geminicoccus roseus]